MLTSSWPPSLPSACPLTCCVPLRWPQTPPLNLPFTFHPFFLLYLYRSLPSLSPSSPSERSCQAVSGARCGREIAACMYTHRCMSTHKQNTWCLCKIDYKACVTTNTTRTHRVESIHLSFASLCLAWLPN